MIYDSQLETSRLVVRPFEVSDSAALVTLFSDPSVARYVDDGAGLSPEDAALWIERSAENLRRYGYGTGAVVRRASAELVGWAGFARPEDGPEQIIYGLAARWWRQGLGSELVGALVDFADKRKVSVVYATVDPANEHSVTLLVKYGFRRAENKSEGGESSHLYQRKRSA